MLYRNTHHMKIFTPRYLPKMEEERQIQILVVEELEILVRKYRLEVFASESWWEMPTQETQNRRCYSASCTEYREG